MIAIGNDPELKALGFRLLIPVHDELIGEAPIENAFRAMDRLSEIMIKTGSEMLDGFPLKGDGSCTAIWYGDEIERPKS